MAKISSTLELIDRSVSAIEQNIRSIERLVGAMSNANQTADSVDMTTPFTTGAQAAAAAENRINSLEREFHDLRNSIPKNIDDELHNIRTAAAQAELRVEELENRLNSLNAKSPTTLTGGFNSLSKAIVVTNQALQLMQTLYQGTSTVMTGADDRVSADSRLSLMKDELHTQEQLEQQIMSVANASRARYETTADLVAKVGRQDFFEGDNDMATRFADIINKGFVVSGASASEMDGAIRQLTQGIASNTLRGDEFNSVMENAPILAEMIADSLNVTKGQLREMAAEGELSSEVVASAILSQGDRVDEMFNKMPQTFGQSVAVIQNYISQIANRLSEPGRAFDRINQKIQDFIAWLDTANGQAFLINVEQGIEGVVNGLLWMMDLAGNIYNFFNDNWTTMAPIMAGIAAAIIGITTALTIYKAIAFIVAAADAVRSAAAMIATGATVAATAAQWGLNAALFACPITWIILAIVALIAIVIAAIVWINKLWETNINFRIAITMVLNTMANQFDNILLFFQRIALAMANYFSYAKAIILLNLQEIVNHAIDDINELIALVNKIPGVNIEAVGKVTFGAEAAAEEYAKVQQRFSDFAAAEQAVNDKAAARAAKLEEDKVKWQAEIDAKNKEAEDAANKYSYDGFTYDKPVNAYVTGGGLDKELDISNTSLEYLNDIAERNALQQFDALNATMQVVAEDAVLSDADKEILMSSAGATSKVYYLQYAGGTSISNTMNQGEDWEAVKRRLKDETQAEIDVGLSDLDEVMVW